MNSLYREVVRSRTRSDLHISKLDDFATFCQESGWAKRPEKSPYEVLRMQRGNEWLIVNKRDRATQHLTVWGNSAEMLRAWFKHRKTAGGAA